jgi:large conductance mechanosensitive channel
MGMYADFQTFLTQANFVTLAVAFIIGAQITLVVTSLVTSVVDPAIAVFFKANFSQIGLVNVNGSTFTFGVLLGAVINFAIVLLVVFLAFVYPMARYTAKKAASAAATTKTCPECFSTINIQATRCAFCTATLPVTPPAPAAAAAAPASA